MKKVCILATVGLTMSMNVGNLVNDGLQTVGDATQKNKNIGNLVNDGINILGDLTNGSNSEELLNIGSLVNEGIKTYNDATQKKPNVGNLVNDGVNILGNLVSGSGSSDNAEELFSKSDFEAGLAEASKIAGAAAREYGSEGEELLDIGSLVNEGIKTYNDATQKKPNVGALVNDGVNILGNLVSGSGSTDNTEELFSKSDFEAGLAEASKIAGAAAREYGSEGEELLDIGSLVNEGIKTYNDATQKKPNVGNLVNDGINIFGNIASGSGSDDNSEELFNIKKIAGDIGKVAKVAVPIISVAADVAAYHLGDDGFVNIGSLVNEGIKTYNDATQKKPNVGNLVNDGVNILGNLVSGSGSDDNTEELFSKSDFEDGLSEVSKIAGAAAREYGSEGEELLNIGSLVNEGIQTYNDATQKKPNVGNLVNDGINILGNIASGSGSDDNSEELFNIKKIAGDIGKVAKVAVPIISVAADVAAFQVEGEQTFLGF